MKKKLVFKNRRGISSIVGSVFFLIIIFTALGYVVYSMNQLDTFSQAIIAKNQQDRDSAHEDFQIISVTTDNNKFNATIQNTGMIPINITRVWVENKTDPTWPISKYSVNEVISPGQTVNKIGENLPLTAKPSQAYGLTFVTDRGNSKEALVNSASAKPLMFQLSAIPDTITSGFDTTVLFAVTNNMSNNGGLSNLTPNLVVNSSLGTTATLISGPEPNVYPFLEQGDTAYFKWIYSIVGNTGQKVNFTASLQNGYLGNSVTKSVTINALQATTKTVMVGGLTGTVNSNNKIYIRLGGDSSGGSYSAKSITMPIAGTFKNLYASKGSGKDGVTFTLYKNTLGTSLTCQVSTSQPSACHDTHDSVSVGINDTVAMSLANSSNGDSDLSFTMEFDPS